MEVSAIGGSLKICDSYWRKNYVGYFMVCVCEWFSLVWLECISTLYCLYNNVVVGFSLVDSLEYICIGKPLATIVSPSCPLDILCIVPILRDSHHPQGCKRWGHIQPYICDIYQLF